MSAIAEVPVALGENSFVLATINVIPFILAKTDEHQGSYPCRNGFNIVKSSGV